MRCVDAYSLTAVVVVVVLVVYVVWLYGRKEREGLKRRVGDQMIKTWVSEWLRNYKDRIMVRHATHVARYHHPSPMHPFTHPITRKQGNKTNTHQARLTPDV